MFNNKDFFRIYETSEKPEACLIVVHGMEEHSSRYSSFASELASNGIACLIYDLPGHGENTGDGGLGWFGAENGADTLTESSLEACTYMKNKYSGVPLVYMGHSMGTMIARCFLQKYDGLIDGMILTGAPNYQPAGKAALVLSKAAVLLKGDKGSSKLLDQLATGSFNKAVRNPRTSLDWLSFNEKNVDAYIADPLCGQPFKTAGYEALFTLMDRMGNLSLYRCNKPLLPVFLAAGEEDPCTGGRKGFEDTVSRMKEAGYEDIEYKLYPRMRHEILNENEKEIVVNDLISWIHKKITSE